MINYKDTLHMTVTTLEKHEILVIPGAIYRTLVRNKLAVGDFLNYSKVRKFLSLDDMALWFYLNDKYEIDRNRISTTYLDFVFDGVTPEYKQEIQQSVVPLSLTEDVAHSSVTMLTSISGGGAGKYSFVVFDNFIWVVINEGFNDVLTDPALKAEFVRDCLKKSYQMAPVHEVNQSSLFFLYMKMLSSQG